MARHRRHGLEYVTHLNACMDAIKTQTFLHGLQQFTKTEQPDDGNQKADAFDQFGKAEGQAYVTGNAVHADGGKSKAEHHRDERLEWRAAAHTDKAGESQQKYGEVFRRTELQGKLSDPAGQHGNHHDTKQRAGTCRHEGQGQGVCGVSLTRHWVTVKSGGDR